MQKRLLIFTFLLIGSQAFFSCKKSEIQGPDPVPSHNDSNAKIYTGWPETMESGTKTSYTAGNVTLSTGLWNFNDALIGNSTSDRKSGTKSARIQNSGKLTMNFNLSNGAVGVTVHHAVFGTDASSTWELWASTNSGSSWAKIGNTITTSSTTLATASFAMSLTGNVRFEIRKLSGGRLNIDNISVDDNTGTASATRDDNMALGNPSGAQTNLTMANNYLVSRSQYSLSYNNARGTCNWVSWHLSSAWKGSATRCDCFSIDPLLPTSFFRATTSNYTNTGFDRGHMCPSDDRDGSAADNQTTFYMSNIIPQAPNNNQITWGNMENYLRTLLSNQEIYIISGCYGQGGTGSNGGTTNTIAGGSITVPNRIWKIAVILPIGSNDLSRISTATRVIAVNMPNTQTVNSQPWGFYRTSVDAIEAATGYNVLSNVDAGIQSVIEAAVDNGPTN